MYESFKSLELLRHQISTRVDKSIKDYSDESINNSDTVSSTIFSACFSLVISYISHELSLNSLITFVIFICAYILTYFAYKTVLKKARSFIYNTNRHGGTPDRRRVKEIIDKFDHVACDNNLIAKDFILRYEAEQDICLSTFDFYEIYYYAKVSAETIMLVLDNADVCINTLHESTRIDLHRIYNQLEMLLDIKDFLTEHCEDYKVRIDENLRLVLINQISELSSSLSNIKDICDCFKNDHFSGNHVKPLRDKFSI